MSTIVEPNESKPQMPMVQRCDAGRGGNPELVFIAYRFLQVAQRRLTTPSSATPGRGRGGEHGGARRRRGLCRASWRAAQPVTEPAGPQPRPVTERQSPEFAAAHRSEEHTSELQSRRELVYRPLLEIEN